MPRQKINARADRQRNTLAAWHVDANRLVPLGTDLFERVVPIRRQRLAYAVNWAQYAMDRTIGRPSADVYLVDIETGARTKVKDAIDDQYLQASPGGRYLLYLQADQYWTIDTATRATANISKPAQTSFINRESDATVKQKPAFGVAGWTKNDEAVILYDKFDAWRVAANGSSAARLTDGATDQIRHRYARLDPDEEWIDTSQPLHFAPLRYLDEAVRLRATRSGRCDRQTPRARRQEHHRARKGQRCRRLRLHRPGVQRSAGRDGWSSRSQ